MFTAYSSYRKTLKVVYVNYMIMFKHQFYIDFKLLTH